MKIFGKVFTTKRELINTIADQVLDIEMLEEELTACEDELDCVRKMFPFDLCQVVYDVALKNAKGRYTKTKPSFEHSTIAEVTVDETNYFSLVKRYNRKCVFFTRDEAEEHLNAICK